ncbi:MAG: hypothetical protein PHG91_06170 [Syntrophales bacterium]|nr:hypothetical protein [Syntrophales bacterium]MDD5532997.1 hypothetical protein [Syntrophales bacterium]
MLDPGKLTRKIIRRLVKKHKGIILSETRLMSDFMRTLMKGRNTGEGWTSAERALIRDGLKHLSIYVPLLIIFSLPGGALLLPFLAEILDRRKRRRLGPAQERS